MADEKVNEEYRNSVLSFEGPIQQYIASITGVPVETLWPDGIMQFYPTGTFKRKDGTVWNLALRLLPRDHKFDSKPIESKVFRNTLQSAVINADRIFRLRISDPTIPAGFAEARLACDPSNTSLVAYVPGPDVKKIRDMPKRLCWTIERVPT